MAGDASGEVYCLGPNNTWTPSGLAGGAPVHWLSTTTLGASFAAVDLGGTDTALYTGGCTDGWTEVTNGPLPGALVDVHASDLGIGLALADGTVWFSDINAQTFVDISPSLLPWSVGAPLQLRVDGGGRVLVFDGTDTHVWDGMAWATWLGSPLSGAFEVSPSNAALIFDGGDVARSSGGPWSTGTAAESGQFAGVAFDALGTGPQRIWSARSNRVVVTSNNDGASFVPLMKCFGGKGIPNDSAVRDIEIGSNELLYLATSTGVFRENGGQGNPCYDSPSVCEPICPPETERSSGEPDDTLERPAWSDGAVSPVTNADGETAHTARELVGTLVASNNDVAIEVDVRGDIRYTMAPCDGVVCPWIIDALAVQLDGASADVGGGLAVESVIARVTTPASGGWRPETGEVLVAGPSIHGDVQIGWGTYGEWILPEQASGRLIEPLRGTIDERGVSLWSTMSMEGMTFTLTLASP